MSFDSQARSYPRSHGAIGRAGRGGHVASTYTVPQSSFTLTTVRGVGRPFERLLGARRVVELALGVVVQHQQAQRRPAAAGEAQHRDVAVGVAAGDDRSAAGAAPDADRLHRSVVEHVGLGEVLQVAGRLVVLEGVGAADHPLRRDAVQVAGERAHEVTIAAGGDVRREAVGLEVAQQLDHRPVGAVAEEAADRRVRRAVDEVGGLRAVLVDGEPGERRQDAGHQHLHLAVVAGVVLRHDVAQPLHVVLVRGLPRLPGAERLVERRHLGEALEDEGELDRQRLLAPQRAVVVERGDALFHGHEVGSVGGDALDVADDRLPRGGVVPAREQFLGRHRPSASSGSLRQEDRRRTSFILT